MQRFKISLILLLLIIMVKPAFSQQVTVTASIDSSMILIGQQSLMHINVSGPSGIRYYFPQFPGDTLVKGIEVLARGPIDTLENKNGEVRLRADYIITSFDSGLYYIPPVKILAGKDTYASDFLALKVLTYNVNTKKPSIFDIKGVEKPPFVLGDFLPYIILFVLIYAIALLVIWLILKKKYGIRKTKEELQIEQLLPPHVKAIMELDRLKTEKPWKEGRDKEFYIRLSEIVRSYIDQRFKINAREMTTADILALFDKDRNTRSVFQNLNQILQLSDLVKFAKVKPLENENELSLMNAYLFVNQTKEEEVKPVEEQKEEFMEQHNPDEGDKTGNDAPGDDENDYYKKFQPK